MSAITSAYLDLPLPQRGPRPRLVPPPAPKPSVYEEFNRLRESLARTTSFEFLSGSELTRDVKRHRQATLATTVAPLDQLLGGGIRKGTLVEITGWRSTGRFSIVLATLAAATSTGEAAALVDLGDHLDPESAALAGVDLPRLLWVRPETTKDAVAATEMLISTGFPLVTLDLGMRLRGRRVYDAAWVRLARAAENNETALLVTSPWPVSGTAADASISMTRSRPRWQGRGKAPRILVGARSEMTVEKRRGAAPGEGDELSRVTRESV